LRGRLEATAEVVRRSQDRIGLSVTAGGEHLNQRTISESSFPNFGAPGMSASRSSETTRTNSAFVQAELRAPEGGRGEGAYRWDVIHNAVLTAGHRVDDHSEFGDEGSPYLGARTEIFETTLRASYGEGFRAPKPAELFDPFVGNADLGAETSESVDVGVSREFFDGLFAGGVTWFRLRVDDLIAYDPSTFKIENFSRTETEGWEYEAAANLGGGFRLRGSFTQQTPRDEDTGQPLPNRARRFGSAGISWECDGLLVSLDGFFSGSNPGSGGEFSSPDRVARENPGRRTLVDLTARWRSGRWKALHGHEVTVFAGIRNLLDDEWVATPNSPAGTGIGVFAGVQLDF
jgi:outer membrane cobalamin receptor